MEDLLNTDMIFGRRWRGAPRATSRSSPTTSEHVRSLKKYESRLNDLGIKVPESVKRTIKQYLKED